MAQSPHSDSDYRLLALLRHTLDALQRVRDKELRKLALSPGAADLLFAVKAIGSEATPAQISRWTFRQEHSVAGLLNRLEARGLVRRARDLDRKNLVRVSLTRKGEEAFRAAWETSATKRLMSGLTAEQREQLTSYLCALRDKALDELHVEGLSFLGGDLGADLTA